MKITARYAPQIWVIKDGQGHLLTEPGEVKQRWRQYFDTLYNDPNAVNIDCSEKHFGSHSNPRDDEKMLNIDKRDRGSYQESER